MISNNFLQKYFDLSVFRTSWLILSAIILFGLSYFLIARYALNISIYGLEIFGVTANLISNVLVRKQSLWAWYISCIATILLMFHYFNLDILGQSLVQLYMFIMNLIIIYFWIHPSRQGATLTPSPLSFNLRVFLLIVIMLLIGVNIAVFSSPLRVMDFTSLYLCVAGDILLTKKKIEVWILFIIANVLNIIIFFYNGSYMAVGLAAFLLTNACIGLYQWRLAYLALNKSTSTHRPPEQTKN